MLHQIGNKLRQQIHKFSGELRPLMILTTEPMRRSRKVLRYAVETLVVSKMSDKGVCRPPLGVFDTLVKLCPIRMFDCKFLDLLVR